MGLLCLWSDSARLDENRSGQSSEQGWHAKICLELWRCRVFDTSDVRMHCNSLLVPETAPAAQACSKICFLACVSGSCVSRVKLNIQLRFVPLHFLLHLFTLRHLSTSDPVPRLRPIWNLTPHSLQARYAEKDPSNTNTVVHTSKNR